jgi:hypothetical protein
MHSNIMTPRLGFAIQKGLAALLVARLHIYIYVYIYIYMRMIKAYIYLYKISIYN